MSLRESAEKIRSDDCWANLWRCVERLFVLLMPMLIVLGLVFLAIAPEPENTRAGKIIILLNNNWKVMLLLLVPLFYGPVRRFLDEVEEFRGMKRPRQFHGKPPTRVPEDKPK